MSRNLLRKTSLIRKRCIGYCQWQWHHYIYSVINLKTWWSFLLCFGMSYRIDGACYVTRDEKQIWLFLTFGWTAMANARQPNELDVRWVLVFWQTNGTRISHSTFVHGMKRRKCNVPEKIRNRCWTWGLHRFGHEIRSCILMEIQKWSSKIWVDIDPLASSFRRSTVEDSG